MESAKQATLYSWDEIPREELNPLIERQLVVGDQIMIGHIHLKKGAVVPLHHHVNEQMTYVLSGALRFWLGEDESEEVVVRQGQVLLLPSNLPHKAEALEDTLDVDIFCPPRQDWINKTDDYLRGR